MGAGASHPQATLSPESEKQEVYVQRVERDGEPQPENQQAEEEKPREEHENHQDEYEGETAAGEGV